MNLNLIRAILHDRRLILIGLSVFAFWFSPVYAENKPSASSDIVQSSQNSQTQQVAQNAENAESEEAKASKNIYARGIGSAYQTSIRDTKRQEVSSWSLLAGNLTKVLLALFFVLFLVYLAYYLSNKLKLGGVVQNKNIKLLEVYPLGTKEKLLIVQVDDKRLLLGATPSQINLLTQLDNNFVQQDTQNPKKHGEKVKFNDILHRFSLNKYDKNDKEG